MNTLSSAMFVLNLKETPMQAAAGFKLIVILQDFTKIKLSWGRTRSGHTMQFL